ncbi:MULTISPECIES: serine/threonine-protein kinase [Streptomyces]|uniref:serine/threonine-protein kinase n=1 Tax=Streptomyces TaxID=1883 RepID=UPI00069A4003|nr:MULTISPECIES: serine/threonine-protein kinase [Streptomyces]MYU52424.1 protein kinase [Streptomyces sp. SID7805]
MGSFGGEGRLIAGRYRLGVRLGRGGMGTVWRASDQLLDRQVAVKELHLDDDPGEPAQQVQRERTMREARTVARIKHPNVIVVHDVVEQDGRPWIVMELVEGPSLADRLSGGGPVAPREAARIGVALLGALRAAHARGVLHRDLKPANVLMEAGTGRVVLTDFGIAKVPGVSTLTETGGFVGSPEYTAPERMAGQGAGPEADLWSLGVLLCTALSGESPFRRDSLGGILHAVIHDTIELPEAARPLLAVVGGLLERDPLRRLGVGETERLLRGYLHSGRAPEREAAGHGPGGVGAPAAAHRPEADRPATHAPLHDGPGDGPPSGHPAGEDPADGRFPAAGGAPGPGPAGRTPDGRAHGRPSFGRGGRTAGRAGGRTPGVPIPDALDDRALAAAARPHTGRIRTVLLIVLAVLVLGGAGAGIAVLIMNRSGADGGDTGDVTDGRGAGTGRYRPAPDPHPTQDIRPRRAAPGARHPEGAPGTAVTAVPSAPGDTADAPAGYGIVRDPAGFALAVPHGFTRSYEKPRVYYYSAGRRFRLGIHLQRPAPDGPLGAMRAAHAQGPGSYPGYHAGRVTGTTHHGHPAALWEFSWDGGPEDGGPRHTYDLSWDQDGRMIDVWVSAPVGQLAESRRHFATALGTFRAADPDAYEEPDEDAYEGTDR